MTKTDSSTEDEVSDKSRSYRVTQAGGPFELIVSAAPEPGPGQVRIAVAAAGICHTDCAIVAAAFGDVFPVVPGHEIAGHIAAVSPDVDDWHVGERVAVGWFGGNCGTCTACRLGDPVGCSAGQVPGLSYPGGYADAIVVPTCALARVPDALSSAEAAVMGCAAVTVFNALRHSGARAGDVVAVLGLGGLGHLGVQFAAKMGFVPVVVNRGSDKAELALSLGAARYINSSTEDVAAGLQSMGGARVVLATASSGSAMTATVDGLTRNGELIVIGADSEPITVTPYQLILGVKKIYGVAAGTAKDVEETMQFAALTGVRPLVEEVPLDEVQTAFARTASGAARFRMVLVPGR